MATFLRRVPDQLLTLGAVAGAIALTALVAGLLVGVRPVYLRSGSMAPTMPTGTLALAQRVAAPDVAIGDVVCVEKGGGSRVTHRVVGIEHVGSTVLLRLQGDANAVPDAQPYAVTEVYRVIAHVPRAGYLLAAVSSPLGLVTLGAAVTGLLVLIARGGRTPPSGGRRRRDGEGRDGRSGPARPAGRAVAASAGALFLALGPGQATSADAAAWTDDLPATGAAFTAAVVPAPASFACGGLGVLSVQFSWSAVAGATNYTLHYGAGGSSTATIVGTTATLTAAISGGTAWVEANRVFGATTWTSVASTSRSYTVAVVSLCS